MFQSASRDRGGEKPAWVICTDVGGRTFLHEIAHHVIEKRDVLIWCANLEKAKRFSSIGDLCQAISYIPPKWEAYEEDPRLIDRNIF